jgi:hypothetical protein
MCKIAANAVKNTFKAVKRASVLALTWMDRKVVKFITTAHKSPSIVSAAKPRTVLQDDGTTQRTMMNYETLNVARDYNNHMNGVDVADQLRGSYPTKIRSRKWWHVFFWWVLDTCICNAYVMYSVHCTSISSSPMSHLQFREQLALALMEHSTATTASSSPSKKRIHSMNARPVLVPSAHHFPVRVAKNSKGTWQARECVVCTDRKRTTYECGACDVGLCVTCFAVYHVSSQ